jgi:hypothetical protein
MQLLYSDAPAAHGGYTIQWSRPAPRTRRSRKYFLKTFTRVLMRILSLGTLNRVKPRTKWRKCSFTSNGPCTSMLTLISGRAISRAMENRHLNNQTTTQLAFYRGVSAMLGTCPGLPGRHTCGQRAVRQPITIPTMYMTNSIQSQKVLVPDADLTTKAKEPR